MILPLLVRGRRLIAASMPGLLHSGVDAITLAPMFLTEKIRIYIPDREILNLDRVTIVGPSAERLASATCTLSSMHRSSAPAAGILSGKAIHTEREVFPYWELSFDAPQEVQEITILNRLGVWGGRSYGLCVDLYAPTNVVWRFDNAGPETLRMRLGQALGAIRALADSLASLPERLRAPMAAKRTEILRSATALIDLVETIIQGASSSQDEVRAARARLISAVNDVCSGRTASGEIIQLSALVLDFLLERSERSRAAPQTDAEIRAVGIVFTAEFLRKGRVSLSRVRENEIFLGSTEATRAVETIVNELYTAAGGDKQALPIMFRSHGMSGAELRMNADKFVASMQEMETLFGELGYDCAVCYGSFLGAVRTGEFIPHDDDVDMAIVLKGGQSPREELAQIAATLTSRKISAKLVEGYDFLKVKAPGGGKHVDIFPVVPKDASTVQMYMDQLKLRDVRRDLVLPFGEVVLYGKTFKAPANADGFLADRYGADWKVPKRQIGANMLEV